MAATIVVIRDEATWAIVQDLLGQLEEGGIIVPPETIERLDENCPGWEDMFDEKYIDYDFGGEPNVMIDIARDNNLAAATLDDYLIERQRAQTANDQNQSNED